MAETVDRWVQDPSGKLIMTQPLTKDIDYTGIPQHLQELWYEWQVQVPCGLSATPVSAADALIYENVNSGKSYRPATLPVENGFAIVPQEFVTKLAHSIYMPRIEHSFCVDSFEQAHQPLILDGPFNREIVIPATVVKKLGIPQPKRQAEVADGLSNMMQYIYTIERNQADETLNPWQTILFVPMFDMC